MLRVTIICADLGKLPIPALEYLVLYLNRLQSDVEFQIAPAFNDNLFMDELAPDRVINWDEFESKIADFVKWVNVTTQDLEIGYELQHTELGSIAIISLSSLNTNWYSVYQPDVSTYFLGKWETHMAPPSILESIITLIISEGIYRLIGLDATRMAHITTRGCPGDFNMSLIDTRYKTLVGSLCKDCLSQLEEAIGVEHANLWNKLLKKRWIGTLDDPYSPASHVSKLGYNLFVTKGLAPTPQEKVVAFLKDEGSKQIIQIFGAVLVALVLVWLGLG